jgi:hypothetical protein
VATCHDVIGTATELELEQIHAYLLVSKLYPTRALKNVSSFFADSLTNPSLNFSVWSSRSDFLPSLDDGELEA